jgi:hypothetical protein
MAGGGKEVAAELTSAIIELLRGIRNYPEMSWDSDARRIDEDRGAKLAMLSLEHIGHPAD